MNLKKETRKNLIVLFSSLVAGFFCLEILLRAYFSTFLDFDIEMWQYARNLKQSVSDERSHIHVPLASAKIMGAETSINSKWLRDREFEYEKPQGITRVLVIGDSVTFGFWVDGEKTFSKVFEKRLNEKDSNGNDSPKKYEVINAGIGNYNTKQELALYEAELRKYDADQIILAWYVNDAEETQKYRENFFTKHSIVFVFLRSVWQKVVSATNPDAGFQQYYATQYAPKNWENYEKTLEKITKTLGNRKLTVVLLPELHILNPYPFGEIHRAVGAFFENRWYRVIDLLPAFAGQKSETLWVAPDDVHPNALWHELLGQYLFTHWNDASEK